MFARLAQSCFEDDLGVFSGFSPTEPAAIHLELRARNFAESAMREVIGQNDIQPILTKSRQEIEDAVKVLIQRTLDSYHSGIQITQVTLLKVDAPADVVAAFTDVQAARADQERARNEAETYANKIVPEARGEAQQMETKLKTVESLSAAFVTAR